MVKNIKNSYGDFLIQFEYVKKVVNSCKTNDQRKNIENWVEKWAKRMENESLSTYSWDELYSLIITEKQKNE